jgi:hypothetical protein
VIQRVQTWPVGLRGDRRSRTRSLQRARLLRRPAPQAPANPAPRPGTAEPAGKASLLRPLSLGPTLPPRPTAQEPASPPGRAGAPGPTAAPRAAGPIPGLGCPIGLTAARSRRSTRPRPPAGPRRSTRCRFRGRWPHDTRPLIRRAPREQRRRGLPN